MFFSIEIFCVIVELMSFWLIWSTLLKIASTKLLVELIELWTFSTKCWLIWSTLIDIASIELFVELIELLKFFAKWFVNEMLRIDDKRTWNWFFVKIETSFSSRKRSRKRETLMSIMICRFEITKFLFEIKLLKNELLINDWVFDFKLTKFWYTMNCL